MNQKYRNFLLGLFCTLTLAINATSSTKSQLINHENEKVYRAAIKIYNSFYYTAILSAFCIVVDEDRREIYQELRKKWFEKYQEPANIVEEVVHKFIKDLGLVPTEKMVEDGLNRITIPILIDLMTKYQDSPNSLTEGSCPSLIIEGPDSLPPDPYASLAYEFGLVKSYLERK